MNEHSACTEIKDFVVNEKGVLTKYQGNAIEIVVPDGVTEIGEYAFSFCNSVTSITLLISVTMISAGAFECCNRLTSITIPNSVTLIGEGAFFRCMSLTSITIPNSVTNIVEWAFTCCSSLTRINVDSDNKNYCSVDGVLFSKDKRVLMSFPNSNCTNYTIPASVTAICEGAFFKCSSLVSITIPKGVTEIGKNADRKSVV